jgi:hypothetical protein
MDYAKGTLAQTGVDWPHIPTILEAEVILEMSKPQAALSERAAY